MRNCAAGRLTRQQEIEIADVTAFEESYPAFPDGAITPGEDPPDIHVAAKAGIVAIEHTRVFREVLGMPMQQREGQERGICSEAQRVFECRNPSVYALVDVQFQRHMDLVSDRRHHLAEFIADEVARHVPSADSTAAYLRPGLADRALWPRELAGIHLWRQEASSRWGAWGAAFVGRLEPADLQTIIGDKSAPVLSYRNLYKQLWLLIVADHGNHSSIIDPSVALVESQYVSTFDRTFLFFRATRRVYMLRTT